MNDYSFKTNSLQRNLPYSDDYDLFKSMYDNGYSLEQIKQLIGLSDEEIDLYSNLLHSEKVVSFSQEQTEDLKETKKAI